LATKHLWRIHKGGIEGKINPSLPVWRKKIIGICKPVQHFTSSYETAYFL
jgi:hypothetical protein